jgi:predicted nicotinamide N-methyase
MTNFRVLELGSGTGMAGMVLSKVAFTGCDATPACVVLTDGDKLAVSLLERNLKNEFNRIPENVVKATSLRWGIQCLHEEKSNDPDNENNALHFRRRDPNSTNSDSLERFDSWCRKEWTSVWNDNDEVTFDILLAGDVLYKQELPKLFFETVQQYLAREKGILWLCHVPRAGVTHDIVAEAAFAAGFKMELYWKYTNNDEAFSMEGCPLDDLERARIYKVTRSNHSENSKYY